jgi:predicted branched-subunit amino acid permease
VVKAVLSGLLTAALLGLSVAAWRRQHRWHSLLTALLTAAALIVVVANVYTVANPDPGFLLLLQGSGV